MEMADYRRKPLHHGEFGDMAEKRLSNTCLATELSRTLYFRAGGGAPTGTEGEFGS